MRFDKSFGSDGLARLSKDLRTGSQVANAPGGKLVLGLTKPRAVMRFMSGGQVDRAFGQRGIARIHTGPRYMGLNDVIVDRRGRVLAGGSLRIPDHDAYRAGIFRLLADGSPDRSFGRRGLSMPNRLKSASVSSLTFASGGRIIATGQLKSDRKTDRAFVACFDAQGDLVRSFGDNGMRVLRFGPSQSSPVAAVDGRGRIVLGNGTSIPPLAKDNWIFEVVRLTANGKLDSSFSGDGRATVDPSGESRDTFTDLTVDRAGRTLLVGWGSTGLVVRFRPDGRLDKSFANAGRKALYMSDAMSVAVDDRGRIIIGGFDPGEYDSGSTAIVHRLLSNGRYDPTLPSCYGLCSYDFYGFGDLVIDDRNRIVLAPIYSNVGLVRLTND